MSTATPKGKGKASERTPLLDEYGRPLNETLSTTQPLQSGESSQLSTPLQTVRRAWRSHLLTATLAFLTLLFGLMLGIILLTDSYASPAWHNVSKALSNSGRSGDKFWKEAMLVRGPDAVHIMGMGRKQDEAGDLKLEVNLSVTMRVAVDTDFIMGFREEGAEDDGWWRKQWKALGRWGVRRLGNATAVSDSVIVYPLSPSRPDPLITFKPLSPIALPLQPGLSLQDHYDPPSSLQSLSVPLMVYPSQNASLLFEFFKQSWAQGFVSVRIQGSRLMVHGGDKFNSFPKWWELGRWRNWLKLNKEDVTLDLRLPIPPIHIPSHPPSKPGSELPKLSKLLTLESFNISSVPSMSTPTQPYPSTTSHSLGFGTANSESDQRVLASQKSLEASTDVLSPQPLVILLGAQTVLISARAALAHPFPALAAKLDLGHGIPSLPFVVSLPVSHEKDEAFNAAEKNIAQRNVIPVAEVSASLHFNKTHILIPLSGHILPLSNSSSHLSDAISSLVSSYLSYKPSPISITSPLYPSMEVRAEFPPPSHRLEILRDFKVENMSVYPGLGSVHLQNPGQDASSFTREDEVRMLEILASATVHARVVLPPGMNIDVRVVRLWIDCFVFDGKVPMEATPPNARRDYSTLSPSLSRVDSEPETEEPPLPRPLPLPTPLPLRAFARITPRTWLNATSLSVPNKGERASDVKNSGGNDETGTNVYVTAQLVDVPLEVLPGRQGDLSRFVSKVLFSNGPVIAGIRGVAAVGVGVPGLTAPASSGPRVEGSELILTGLPFEGNVQVGGHDS